MPEATPINDPTAASREEIAAVADTFVELTRSFMRARARMMAEAEHDVEWSAHVLLKRLATAGPTRASTLADCMHSDPSTISRQVASLVKDGLVERRADPADGRASLLVLTAKADSVLADHDELRLQHFSRMLADWDSRDLRRFARLLHRFTTDFENAHDDWMAERTASAERNR